LLHKGWHQIQKSSLYQFLFLSTAVQVELVGVSNDICLTENIQMFTKGVISLPADKEAPGPPHATTKQTENIKPDRTQSKTMPVLANFNRIFISK
jgi:hypothetical protein